MAKLCDICHFINGDRGKNYPSQAEIRNYGDVPFINAGHIIDGKLDFSEMNYISQEKYNQLNSGKIQENDILYCLRGSLGKKAIVKGISIGAIASSLVIIRPNIQRINSEYLFYALESPTVLEQMMQANNGTSQPNLSAKSVGDYTFNLPAINEQIKIVSKLGKVNDLISLRKQQLAKLDELVKARFVEMFGSLNDREKGLDIVSIEELCTLIKDGTHQTPSYTEDKQNGFKFLSSKDVMTQKICWDDIKYIPAELHEKLYATIQPQRNDILMSKNGVNYGVAAVNDTDEIFDIYVSLALLRPRTDMVNPIYLRCVINNPDTKRQFDSSIKGIGVPNLHLGEIKKTNVLLPPIDKQNEFVAFVEQTDKSKLEVQKSLEKLELLKKALMQKYFG